MPHGLLTDIRGIFGKLAATSLGDIKAYIITYAEKKAYEYWQYLKQQCPPPEILKLMGKILDKINKLIAKFDKKIKAIEKLPKLLDPAIKAGKIVVGILSHLIIPAAWIPVGVATSLSNLLVFLRKMVETFETDIRNVAAIIRQVMGVFDPVKAKLAVVESVLIRCAETPDIYGGSGYTWGRFSGSAAALATIDLNESGSSPLFPVNTIVVDDKRYILSSVVTGSFFDTGSNYTTNTNVLIYRPDLTAAAIIALGGANAVSSTLIGDVGAGNGTLLNTGGAGGTGTVGTGTVGTGIGGNGTVGTGTGGLAPNSGFGTGGQGGTTNASGTFIPNNQSSTGGTGTNSNSKTGNGTDGVSNRGTLIAGTGTGGITSGKNLSSENPGILPTGTGIYIDNQEVGFTPEGRLALLNNVNDAPVTALITDSEYKAANGETYFLSILEDKLTEYVAPRRYAVAKDRRGVIVLQGPKSFASNQQVLLDELKFRIDRRLP